MKLLAFLPIIFGRQGPEKGTFLFLLSLYDMYDVNCKCLNDCSTGACSLIIYGSLNKHGKQCLNLLQIIFERQGPEKGTFLFLLSL